MIGIRGDGSSEEVNRIVYPGGMNLKRNMCLLFYYFKQKVEPIECLQVAVGSTENSKLSEPRVHGA